MCVACAPCVAVGCGLWRVRALKASNGQTLDSLVWMIFFTVSMARYGGIPRDTAGDWGKLGETGRDTRRYEIHHGRYGIRAEIWGDTGRYGEIRVDTGRYGEIRGDRGEYAEIEGDKGR